MEGGPPEDPSVLDTDEPLAAQPDTEVQQITAPQSTAIAQPQWTEPSRHQLLSASHLQQHPTQPKLQPPNPAPAPAPAPGPAPVSPQNDLFSLDFHAPSQSVQQQAQSTQPKNAKQDILSLFSTPAPNPVAGAPQNLWGQPQQSTQQPPTQQQQVQGMMGQTGTGMWGVSSGWNTHQPQSQSNVWGGFTTAVPQQPQQQQGSSGFGTQPASNGGFGEFQQSTTFSTTDVWANNNTTTPTTNNQQKDAFDDIWGGFK